MNSFLASGTFSRRPDSRCWKQTFRGCVLSWRIESTPKVILSFLFLIILALMWPCWLTGRKTPSCLLFFISDVTHCEHHFYAQCGAGGLLCSLWYFLMGGFQVLAWGWLRLVRSLWHFLVRLFQVLAWGWLRLVRSLWHFLVRLFQVLAWGWLRLVRSLWHFLVRLFRVLAWGWLRLVRSLWHFLMRLFRVLAWGRPVQLCMVVKLNQ